MAEWWRSVVRWLGMGPAGQPAPEPAGQAISDADRADLALAHAHVRAIRHVFPPVVPLRSMSFLGGDPLGPDDLDVPMVIGTKGLIEALTFVAQIDLNTLPDGPARRLLPKDGYLYFFAPMSDTLGPEAYRSVCRYVPGRVTSSWGPQPRLAAGPIMDPLDKNPWLGWVANLERSAPRTYYRVEIELGWLAPAGEVEPGDSDAENGFPWEVVEQRRRDALTAFHGPPVENSSLLRPPPGGAGEELWIPFAGFPTNVRAAQVLGGFVKTWLKEEEAAIDRKLAELPEEARADLEATKKALKVFGMVHSGALMHIGDPPEAWARPLTETRREQVLEMLRAMRSDAFPASVADRYFRSEGMPQALDRWLSQAAVLSAEVALADAKGASTIPPEVVEALRHRHDVRGHQLFGAGVVVQEAADRMAEEGHVLLLQLVPDAVTGWDHGELGALQYWIRPEDLRAGRFEATELTVEAY